MLSHIVDGFLFLLNFSLLYLHINDLCATIVYSVFVRLLLPVIHSCC